MTEPVEFWNLTRVLRVTGLSKSVIYSLMKDGRFPKNRPYRDQPRRRFWLSREVIAWQQEQVDEPLYADEFSELLAA